MRTTEKPDDTALGRISTVERQTAGPTQTEPLAVNIPETSRITGWSRSVIYRDLAAGKLRAVKSGTRTLILMDSIRQRLASLPPAAFRAPSDAD